MKATMNMEFIFVLFAAMWLLQVEVEFFLGIVSSSFENFHFTKNKASYIFSNQRNPMFISHT